MNADVDLARAAYKEAKEKDRRERRNSRDSRKRRETVSAPVLVVLGLTALVVAACFSADDLSLIETILTGLFLCLVMSMLAQASYDYGYRQAERDRKAIEDEK